MSFRIQYTIDHSNSLHTVMRQAIEERKDNIDLSELTEEKKKLLNEYLDNPKKVFHTGEYGQLQEMAGITSYFWNSDEELTLYFMGGTSEVRKRTLAYASEWSEYCGILFRPTEDINEAKIRIGFMPGASYSCIGTNAKSIPLPSPTINFGWLTDDFPEVDFRRVVLHEFGHALGLIHEHQSPAVQIDWDKTTVYNVYNFQIGWDKATVDRNVFQQFSKESTKHSEVDLKSIMAYEIPEWFTKNKVSFPINDVLSPMDKEFIGQIYPKKNVL